MLLNRPGSRERHFFGSEIAGYCKFDKDKLPILWHGLIYRILKSNNSGIKAAVQAQLDTGMPVAKPSTPGFGIIVSLAGLFALYLLIRQE